MESFFVSLPIYLSTHSLLFPFFSCKLLTENNICRFDKTKGIFRPNTSIFKKVWNLINNWLFIKEKSLKRRIKCFIWLLFHIHWNALATDSFQRFFKNFFSWYYTRSSLKKSFLHYKMLRIVFKRPSRNRLLALC